MESLNAKFLQEVCVQLDSLMVMLSSVHDYELADEILIVKRKFESRHMGVKDGEDNS